MNESERTNRSDVERLEGEGTHVRFSRLVLDETLLRPELEDDVAARDARAVQEAYRESIRRLYDDARGALSALASPAGEGADAGLVGVTMDATFDIDEVVEALSRRPVEEPTPDEEREFQEILIRTVDDNDNPDPSFVKFAERRTFAGIRGVGGSGEADLSYSELQQEMRNLDALIAKAREAQDESEVQRLTRMRQAIAADFRSGQPDVTPGSPPSEARSAERLRDSAPDAYGDRKGR